MELLAAAAAVADSAATAAADGCERNDDEGCCDGFAAAVPPSSFAACLAAPQTDPAGSHSEATPCRRWTPGYCRHASSNRFPPRTPPEWRWCRRRRRPTTMMMDATMKTRTRTSTMKMVVVRGMTATAMPTGAGWPPSDGRSRCSATSDHPWSPPQRLPWPPSHSLYFRMLPQKNSPYP